MRAWARRTGTLAMIAAFAVAALAGPAQANKISAKRAQIASIERQLNEFDMKLEASIEAFDGARQHLADVHAQIRENTIRLRIARHNLKIARIHLANFLVSAYKEQGSNDPTAYVLGSGSFNTLIDRVEYVQRIARSESELLDAVTSAEREISHRQAALRKEEDSAAKLLAQARAHKATIQSQLRARQHLLDSVQGDLRRLIDQRREARDRAAREQARRYRQRRVGRLRRHHLHAAAGRHPGRTGRGARAAVPRRAVCVGRRQPVRLRLLGPGRLRLWPARRLAAALYRSAVDVRIARRQRPARARGSRLLLPRPGARRHLHRRRAVHPRSAHR
jgi:peptidoglycan hydrolase CwlO-like protein